MYFVDKDKKTRLLAQLVPGAGGEKRPALHPHQSPLLEGGLGAEQVRDHPAAAIHGNKSQTARQQALADFRAGKLQALVATDIAARGLDIEELSHVFNYNLPEVPETYVHRIGRTRTGGPWRRGYRLLRLLR
ncbi:MAG: C-terminal helicase domain-containing protein [Eubacteriales bacterium]